MYEHFKKFGRLPRVRNHFGDNRISSGTFSVDLPRRHHSYNRVLFAIALLIVGVLRLATAASSALTTASRSTNAVIGILAIIVALIILFFPGLATATIVITARHRPLYLRHRAHRSRRNRRQPIRRSARITHSNGPLDRNLCNNHNLLPNNRSLHVGVLCIYRVPLNRH